MKEFSGFYAALPTPFSSDGAAVATDALGQLVRRNIESGLTGLYVGGSTGEAFLMSPEERKQVLVGVADAAAGNTRLIAHVGDVNPAVSHKLAKVAESLGYDAISAVPPFYYGYGVGELRHHYERLAAATDLPFIIYNFPKLSGVTLSPDDLSDLLTLNNVVGVKNTCADLFAFEKLRRRAPAKTLLHGFDETLLTGLSLGADGGIGSTYNIQAFRVLALAEACNAGKLDAAQEIQGDMNALIEVLVRHGVIASLKHLLSVQGIPMGPCRPPFLPLDQDARTAIERLMDDTEANSAISAKAKIAAEG